MLTALAEERVPIDAPAKFDDDGQGALSALVSKDLLLLEGDRWTFRSESVREVADNTLDEGIAGAAAFRDRRALRQ